MTKKFRSQKHSIDASNINQIKLQEELNSGKINLEDIKIIKQFGQGAYGMIYLGTYNLAEVVIKIIPLHSEEKMK